MKNIFNINGLNPSQDEHFETLLINGDLRIERIVTLVPYTEPGDWYDQESDEWVILLKGNARIEFEAGDITELVAGDYVYIPAHKAHRVTWSTPGETCIWLAVHSNLK